MTRESGAVSVVVKTSAFGAVRGTRSVADIVDGKAQALPEADAVACEPLDPADAPVDSGDDAPGPRAEDQETDKVEPDVAGPDLTDRDPTDERPNPSDGADDEPDPEFKARSMLVAAENLHACGMETKAIIRLEILLQKYPKTEAAEKARTLLKKWKK